MSHLVIVPRVDRQVRHSVPLAEIPASTFQDYVTYATAFCMSENGAAVGLRRLRDGDKLFISDVLVEMVSLDRAKELEPHFTILSTADNNLRAILA